MSANAEYYGGKPTIERIVITPYTSVRAAWADLLRGQVDMVYDVGVDALDSLKSSTDVKVYPFTSRYAYLLLLNVRRPHLKDPAFRRDLNAAINRDAFIAEALNGHGTPAEGTWPQHWAYNALLPHFTYHPRSMPATLTRRPLKILFGEPLLERLALVVQRQLQAIGVDSQLELVAGDQVEPRIRAGDFDAVFSDYMQGPNMARPSLMWHTDGPRNFGHYSNTGVDTALDAIRHAADDTAYKKGVAAYQRAMLEDPPAVFLSWRERDRAVSRRFVVPAEPDTDVLLALHLWRPASNETAGNRN
jgi:peptide/nickel transport system substrate-binding protein